MRVRMHGLAALAVVIGLVGAACSSGSSSGGESPSASASASGGAEGTVQIGSEQANNHGSKDVSGETKVELEADNDGSDFYFSPTVLTGSPGQKLTVDIHNEGDTDHNFSIDDQSISQDIAPAEEHDVTVTFPQSGELVFYCEFHRSQGMLGELTTS